VLRDADIDLADQIFRIERLAARDRRQTGDDVLFIEAEYARITGAVTLSISRSAAVLML
jgi:hypothetical protein